MLRADALGYGNTGPYIEGLRKRPENVNNLADLIRFNDENKDKELPEPFHTDQSQFYKSEASKQDDEYYEAVRKDYQLGRTDSINATLKNFALDAIIMPSSYGYASKVAAIAGYPLVSVPLGFLSDATEPTPNPPTPLHSEAPGMPFGLCFMGTAYSEYHLIGFAYAFEQATRVQLQRKAFVEAIPKTSISRKLTCCAGKWGSFGESRGRPRLPYVASTPLTHSCPMGSNDVHSRRARALAQPPSVMERTGAPASWCSG